MANGASCAAITFIQTLAHEVNEGDVETIIHQQKHMLTRFEKTNEMLVNCNALSASRFEVASKELKRHTQLLIDMKKDLDSVFRRIRFLKMKLSQQYPAAFLACNREINVLDEEEEQEEKESKQSRNASKLKDGSSSGSQENSPSFVTSPSSSDDVG
ncbi:kxDL motif-containing protein CG10681 [Tachypleus tridentatus]|uniref:kxDL motif-containing protein CG10681 n=1 Tax=Tachypleus tridentatus TaxID=6853 RepID=UPI003FD4C1B9